MLKMKKKRVTLGHVSLVRVDILDRVALPRQLAERMPTTAIAWHDTVEGCQKVATFRALTDG